MKKIIFSLICLGFFYNTISAMHEYAHEETPTAKAIKMPETHQFHDGTPVEAKAEYVNKQNVQATGQAIPVAAQHSSSIHLDAQAEGHINLEHESPVQDAIAIDENIFEEDFAQPNYTYDTKGNIVSELLDDGSQHTFSYNADGSTTTTIFDPKKIKQQEITTQPDKSSVIKYYDENGKLQATDIINKDGSKVSTKNSLEGNITDSAIFNKTNELEASMQLDNYGNRRATTYHADNTTTSRLFSPEQTRLNDDGTTTTQSTDEQGNITLTIKNSDGKLESKEIIRIDGSNEYTQYDSHENIQSITIYTRDAHGDSVGIEKDSQGKILSKTTLHADAQGITTRTIQDPQGNMLEEAVYNDKNELMNETKFNSDGTEILTEFDPLTQKIISKRITSTDAHGNPISITKNAQDKLIEKGIMKQDGSVEQTKFDPITEHPISISITTVDHTTGVATTLEKKPTGQLISKKTIDTDKNQEKIHYNDHEKPIAKTVTLANGVTMTIPIPA